MGFMNSVGNFMQSINPLEWGKKLTEESASAKDQRRSLDETGLASNQFAEYNQGGYQALTEEARAQREALRRIASGQDSISREQLRQGLQQNVAAQRSMAASAAPQNAAMAARTAAINAGRMGMGMSGQAAIAGLQEQRAAQEALNRMILEQRQQDLQGALGSRQNAISAYGGIKPEGSKLEQWMPVINAGIGFAGTMAGRPGGK